MRTAKQRSLDEERVEEALLGELLPAHDRRIHTKVVGVTFENPDGSKRQDLIGKMTQFDPVHLVRNPHDCWDSNAVMVLAFVDGAKRQVGNLDKDLAAEIAPELDAAKHWKAIATRVGGAYTKGVSLMLYREAKPKVIAKPTAEMIATRAYEIFEARGCEHGSHDQDWQQAEAELHCRSTAP